MRRANLKVFYDDRQHVVSISCLEDESRTCEWRFRQNAKVVFAVLLNHEPEFQEYDLNGDGDFQSWGQVMERLQKIEIPPAVSYIDTIPDSSDLLRNFKSS